MAADVIDFPRPRAPAEKAKAEALIAVIDAACAVRLDNIEATHRHMLKAWNALEVWAEAHRSAST